MLSLRASLIAASLALAAPGAAQPAVESPARADTAVYHNVTPVVVRASRPRATTGGASAVELPLDSTLVRPAPTLEQVLRSMPLVVVRANSRGEAQPALRGGEDRQIAVLIDGVPTTLAWDHRSDLSVVPLVAARNLTLHRGFSSVLFGPNALAGAVEIDIARGPRLLAPPPPLVVDAGADHTGARSAALTAGLRREQGGGSWTLRAGGGYRGSDGAVLPRVLRHSEPATYARLTSDGDLRLNTDLDAADAFFSIRRETSRGGWLSLTGSGFRLERGVTPEAHTVEPRLWRYPFQARGLGALSAGTGMRATPWGRGDVELSLGLDAGRTEIDAYEALDYRTITGGERSDDRTVTARLLADHTLGSRSDLRMALTWADVGHDEVIDGGPEASYRQRLWSLAAETDWRLPGTVPVRFTIGGAADGADTPESSDKPALGRMWDWAGRAGLTAIFREGRLIAHASGGHRARFPALRELYSGALGRFLENPDLRPENQWTGEIGATTRAAGGELQVVAFHQVLENAITRVTVSTPTGNRFQRVNLGRTTADGVEILGDWTLGGVSLGGSGTVQDVHGEDAAGADTDLEYEPVFHGGVWTEMPLPAALRLGVECRGTAEQRYLDVDSGEFRTLPPGVRFDVRLSRGFALGSSGPWRRIETQLAIENLADQALYDQAGLPQPGRTLRLQARLW